MPRKKTQKARSEKSLQVDILRAATIDLDGVDRENRSIPLILATENPVPVYDMERMEVVDEVLILEGMQIPTQVPLVDSHGRGSVKNVLGSLREFEVRDGELHCRAYFASDEMSVDVFNKYAEGHLTDFSVGARNLKREYKGRVKSITRSELIEGSAVVKGADFNAKATVLYRSYSEPTILGEEMMNEALRKLLVERGMAEDADDKQVLEFLQRQLETEDSGIDPQTALEVVRSLRDSIAAQAPADSTADVARAMQRRDDIDTLCTTHNVDAEIRRGYIDGDLDIDAISRDILDRQYQPTGVPVGPGQSVEHGAAERDKFYDAAEYVIVQRSLSGVAVSDELREEIGQAPAGAGDLSYRRIPDIAREFCERANINITGLPPQEIIRRAIGLQSFVERSGGGAAYHTTGSFANLFVNSMHKTLRAAYDEAPSTYQRWVRIAADATDFKNMDKIVFGEMTMPEEVAENNPYPEMKSSDSKESYRVAKHGGIFSITLEMMINDDLDAMSRKVQMQGNAMRRKINRDAYAVLIDNANLSDGIALFHGSSHGANLDATALGEGALDTGFSVMATQSGTDSTTVLGLRPRFLIVPASLGATAQRLVGGGVVPATTGNVPLYGAGGARTLEVVEDGQIDNLGTTTNWWLAADNGQVDTVEISFLQGERTPAIEREDGFDTDTVKGKVRQTYGIKAIDYRGLYQGNS